MYDLSFINLDGTIESAFQSTGKERVLIRYRLGRPFVALLVCSMVNGAGLVISTMDIIKHYSGEILKLSLAKPSSPEGLWRYLPIPKTRLSGYQEILKAAAQKAVVTKNQIPKLQRLRFALMTGITCQFTGAAYIQFV